MFSRFSNGTLIMGAAAIIIGVIGAFAARSLLQPDPVQPAEAMLDIPLANMTLPANRVIEIGDLTVAKITRSSLREQNIPETSVKR